MATGGQDFIHILVNEAEVFFGERTLRTTGLARVYSSVSGCKWKPISGTSIGTMQDVCE